MILVLSFVTGCCMSIAGPSYMALVFDLVDREDLANAIALNSTQFQLARALGPVAAGIAFKLFGIAGCFFANGISFAGVVIGLAMVRYRTRNAERPASYPTRGKFLANLLDGFRYVASRPRVSMLLIISAVTSLFGAPYIAMRRYSRVTCCISVRRAGAVNGHGRSGRTVRRVVPRVPR